MALVDDFSSRLVALRDDDLPPSVAHETRRCLLNVLGTAIGASTAAEFEALLGVTNTTGGAEVVVPGRTEAVDRLSAACAIGFAAHFDDYDDTHLETVIHPGATTLGSIYPLAVLEDVSKGTCLRAMALGVEAQLRVGMAMTPSHYDLGWHITGTCGVIGAAVAAGVLLELDGGEMCDAIGISANMTLGHREAFGTPLKPLHAGKAASNGLLAAMLACRGVSGRSEILAAPGGYFAALANEWDGAWLDPADLGERWLILDNTYKPFPCGIVAHPAIEAAVNLHPRLGAEGVAAIDHIAVRCNPLVVELMGRPTANTGLEARFCAVHGVAVGLAVGAAGLAEFSDELATSAQIDAIRRRTMLEPDDGCSRDAATVTVTLRDGTTISEVVTTASGSRERPLTDGQLLTKFTALVEPVLPGRSRPIAEAVMALGETTAITDIDQVVQGR